MYERTTDPLNESPSEKEGKSNTLFLSLATLGPSMKVPPKRKGNGAGEPPPGSDGVTLNESPSEKEGKFCVRCGCAGVLVPSMKVPPKRKGNLDARQRLDSWRRTLNESPSEKEGKSLTDPRQLPISALPSMKVPPKRKGNRVCLSRHGGPVGPPLNESPSEKEGKCTGMDDRSDIALIPQ